MNNSPVDRFMEAHPKPRPTPADARKARGFTVPQLAKKLGISEDYLYQIEAGHQPGFSFIQRWAGALKVHLHIIIFNPKSKGTPLKRATKRKTTPISRQQKSGSGIASSQTARIKKA